MIYFLLFFNDIEEHAIDIDILNYQEKRPSRGKGKGIWADNCARAREKENGFPSLLLARPKIPLPFPFERLPPKPRKR